MVEGDNVFKEAIRFLNSLPPLKPLQWDENLTRSAQSHVNDIGPKGLLLYQSSDGTEPEDRISKFGNYSESLGENIDFGPNDAMGVLVSLTLDDGEEERPHRENLFKDDYQKVMDFAYDFQPLGGNNNNMNLNQQNQEVLSDENNNMNKNVEVEQRQRPIENVNQNENENENGNLNSRGYNEIEDLAQQTTNLIKNLRVVSKKVEVVTKITYTYEDGSTKVVTQNQSHEFK